MAFLSKKKINGKTYYYALETKRINGKPRVVSQVYLGKAEEIIQKVTAPPRPQAVQAKEFGTIAALMKIAQKLSLRELIDEVVIKRSQGASVGQYLMIAAFNRCSSPTSKSKIGEWYEQTILPRLFQIEPKYLTSQRFWDNMDLVTEEELTEIQVELAKRVVLLYQVDLRVLLYDATNFFTYIDTTNPCTLPQWGHNKQKRNDLRQIGLALLVARDGGIPLFHDTYQGNQADPVEFDRFIRELIKRFNDIFTRCQDLTIVADKGNNSKKNLKLLDESPFHFVGSLVLSHFKDLLAIPLEQYQDCQNERLAGVKYYRTTRKVFDAPRTVLVVFNLALLKGQLQGIHHNLAKTRQQLFSLQEKLNNPSPKGRKPKVSSVTKQVEQILSRQFMKTLFWYKVTDQEGVKLEFGFDNQAFEELKRTSLGKTILFTDRDDWPAEEIILAYRDQYEIEQCFKQMKDPSWVSWDPCFHWTDHKIKVHSFYCFVALLLSSLLLRELANKQINISVPGALEKLSKIKEVRIIYPGKRAQEPVVVTMLTEMDRESKKLFEALELAEYVV
ncbi:IS1634 family transposase [Desulfofundulus thermobenzoicus]|nr:IS1634 family transposase [Desulfofundulus thermobenzoicus]